MSMRKTLTRRFNKLGNTIKKHGKYILNAKRLHNKIAELKEDDKELWTKIWENNGDYINDKGDAFFEEGVGIRYQNLSYYLKNKRKEESASSYTRRAKAIINEEDRAIRWRAIVERANENIARRLREQARIYQPGVEIQLREEGLSQEQIESIENLDERASRYSDRAARAPIILREILDRVDAEMEELLTRRIAPEQQELRDENYHSQHESDSEAGAHGKKHKTRKHKTRKHKTRKHKT